MTPRLAEPVLVQPDVLEALQRGADRSAIVETVGAYGLFLDTNQFDAFADLFAADATYDISPDPKLLPLPLHGRDAIVAAMREVRETTGTRYFPRHLATNVVFRSLDAERAATTSFLVVVFTFPDGSQELRRTGTCLDEFRNEGDRWRFTSRLMQLDTAAGPAPVPDSVPASDEEGK